MNLLTFNDINAQIDAMFTPARRKAALDWAKTPEGRECLAEQRRVLAECTPKPWATCHEPVEL